jgi:hypothetical protein
LKPGKDGRIRTKAKEMKGNYERIKEENVVRNEDKNERNRNVHGAFISG